MTAYAPTPRTRVKRLPKRAAYDRAAVHAILDAGLVCHVGYAIDGQPYVTPTLHWREGERVYWHGSSASRMIRAVAGGVPVCLTVSLIDGLVLARSGFHHSVNYRSAMAFGAARPVADAAEKRRALDGFVDRLFPGRSREIRPPTAQELKATTVLSMDLEEAVAKVRTGPPVDDEEDYALPVWAGVLPLALAVGEPAPDPRLAEGVAVPEYLRARRFG